MDIFEELKRNATIGNDTDGVHNVFYRKYSNDLDNANYLFDCYFNKYNKLIDFGLNVIYRKVELLNQTKVEMLEFCLLRKIITQVSSIRTLLRNGHADPAKTLIRALNETNDVLIVVMFDEDFKDKYGKVDELYDNNKFWYEEISKGKLNKRVESIFRNLNWSKEEIDEHFEYRKSETKFLSESVHSSFNSIFSNTFMYNMDGSDSSDKLCNITVAYSRLLLELLDKLQFVIWIIGEKYTETDYIEDKEYFMSKYNSSRPELIHVSSTVHESINKMKEYFIENEK